MFDFGLYTQVSDSGPHGPLVECLYNKVPWLIGITLNSVALRMAKTLLSFGRSECSRVKAQKQKVYKIYFCIHILWNNVFIQAISCQEFKD